VLSTNANVPPVAQTTVSADLLQAFQIIAELGCNVLSKDLAVLSCLEIFLTIQEPNRDFELTGILDNSDQLFDFIRSQFTSTGVHIDFGFLANQIRESATNTRDFGEGKDDITLSFNIGIQNTQNVLELGTLSKRRRPVTKELEGERSKGCVS